MNYKHLLEHSYEAHKDYYGCTASSIRLEWLAKRLFKLRGFTQQYSEYLATKAVEMCKLLNSCETSLNEEGSWWEVVMSNFPFFSSRIDFSDGKIHWALDFCEDKFYLDPESLFEDGTPITEDLEFTLEEWKEFIDAVIEFAGVDN